MRPVLPAWDYLIVTASNEAQGAAYERQLALRRELGLLPDFRQVLVVTDPGGHRIGSGGSTLLCLMRVLDREFADTPAHPRTAARIGELLRRLRLMIVHAGGDSRRLPAYGPCGKIFIPVPGSPAGPLPPTLFDRLLPAFLALPPTPPGQGQVLVTSGDGLLAFDAAGLRFDHTGITALACPAPPDKASKHGVFVAVNGHVERYLQKPSVETQHSAGAIDAAGLTALDMGVMSFDAEAIQRIFAAFEVAPSPAGPLTWSDPMRERIFARGLDLYRELCCALGTRTTRERYLEGVRASGSAWEDAALSQAFDGLNPIPMHVQLVPGCEFLHFGTTRQLITSGLDLMTRDLGHPPADPCIVLNTRVAEGARPRGTRAWVEGCTLAAPLELEGGNVVTGADIRTPTRLPAGLCLDVVPGRNRAGDPVHFIRCYGLGDTFKDPVGKGGTLMGRPLLQWMEIMGASPDDLWTGPAPVATRTLWDARVFPALPRTADFHAWLWLFDPDQATPARKAAFLGADRYSAADIAVLTDQAAFYERRKTGQVA
jgi:fucokinase